MPLADEIFLPAHAAIRRRLVGLAAEVGAMNHHHRHPARRRHLVLHVHLVDRDVAAAARPKRVGDDDIAADGEAALGLQNERRRRLF